jgi:FkbM family methyltransferase
MRGPIAVPFTSRTWLLMERGMTGATGNFYCGLHEFEDMAFVLNLLRPNDLFVDIGANIGSYSILASGHSGASSVAVEPLPVTFARLCANVRYNNIDDLFTLHNVGIGDVDASLRFTATLDTMNHVATKCDSESDTIEVPFIRMEGLLRGLKPLCVKIDVEGFERKVIDGATSILQTDSLRAVLMEVNESRDRYGFKGDDIHQSMRDFGFLPFVYDPWQRVLHQLSSRNEISGNPIYLRDVEFIRERLSTAPEIELPWRRISRPEDVNEQNDSPELRHLSEGDPPPKNR